MLAGFVGFTPTNGSTSASGKFTPAPIGGHAANGSPAVMSIGGEAVYGPAAADPASKSVKTVAAVAVATPTECVRMSASPLLQRLPRAVEQAPKLLRRRSRARGSSTTVDQRNGSPLVSAGDAPAVPARWPVRT